MLSRIIVFFALLSGGCDSPGSGGSCEFSPDSPLCQPNPSDDAVTDAEVTLDIDSPDTTPPDTTQPDTTPPDTTQPDTTPTTAYRSIIVDDDGIFQNHRPGGTNPCFTSSVGAHGADIDAVALFEADGQTLVSYFDTVQAKLGTLCDIPTVYSDPTEARGAPDGTLIANYVSLGGGAIAGEFVNGAQLLEDDIVVVYEVGTQCGSDTSCGGVDEGYHVWVADRQDCLERTRATCAFRMTGDSGAKGEASVPLTGF